MNSTATSFLWEQIRLVITAAMLIGWMVAVLGCAMQPPEKAISPMDNPWHHYTQAMQALEQNNQTVALERFDQALELKGDFASALAGKALTLATRSRTQTDNDYRNTDQENALTFLNSARKATETPEEQFIYETTAMRVYSELKSEKWLKKVGKHYAESVDIEDLNEARLPYYQNRDAAPYFMGLAFYQAYNFREAEAMLAKVVGTRGEGKWQPRANKLYKKVQRIVRASAGHTLSDVASKIAVKDEVNRGDVAALVVSELKLDKLFAGRIPVQSEVAEKRPPFTPVDVKGHPFSREIETAMKWDMRGLVASYDAATRSWLFRPEDGVTRKELALIFEDVLIKLVGDEGMATAMVGTQHSPYPDVPPEVAWFNAVSTVTTRGLMEPNLSGEFRPNDSPDGSELLLGVFKLRHVLNIH